MTDIPDSAKETPHKNNYFNDIDRSSPNGEYFKNSKTIEHSGDGDCGFNNTSFNNSQNLEK